MSSAIVEKKRRVEQATERLEKIDFKMVTFTLSGKDYGIDIMKIKEISKAGKFTYVPNSHPYVRGVYNLRGDIISIIDLRIMFHLPAEKKQEDALENVLILRLENHVMGIVVDSIDKVVGISSENIQPPHPIFGDINIKYISGVVENANRLYIILDVDRIFSRDKEEKKERIVFTQEEISRAEVAVAAETETENNADLDLSFISETLFSFRGFAVTPFNMEWMRKRFEEWKNVRKAEKKDLQLKEAEEADSYLETFFSPCTGVLWSKEYADTVGSLFQESGSKAMMVWNAGCGGGYETYSITFLLRNKYPGMRIKVWANDSDLLNISTAPNMVFRKNEVPDWMKDATVEGRNGLSFKSEIKDLVMFEYHDILNTNPLEQMDLIIARDVLSFQRPSDQQKLIDEFQEKLKIGGILILGTNERVINPVGWKSLEAGSVKAYERIK